MENALLLLKRVSTTWLSPGHSTWVVDMLLAFVCGLGLFLLLLPCLESQKGPLSHQPPRAVSLGVPTSRQMEAGNPSLHSSDDQNILGIKVTRKVEVKIWKEKEKDGTFLEQMSPGYHLSSLRNMLNSLGAEQDLTVPQPFWEIKDKVKQLLGPQQLSYSKVLGDHFEQKYNQLFWGLPSLHSESLVAAAWISQGASALQPTCFLFNRISSVCSIQVQDKMSPLLSQPQSPPLILSMSQFQPQTLGQFQTQVHLPSSFQALLPSSPPHITDCAASGPTSQNKPQSLLPTEFQPTQMPWIGKQLGCGWALPSVVQRPQEVYNILPPHLSQDNCPDSILPENLPVSSELREQLEQHIQRWLMQPRWDQMQKSLELMQLREELAGTSQEVPGTCRAKDKPCPPQAFLSIGDSSKDSQKVRFQLEKDTGKHLGHILGKVPKDPPKDLENQLGSTLKAHLCLKSGQIQEGLIPWNVYQSWLSIRSTSSTSDTHLESSSLALSETWDTCMGTCAKLPFLDASTQQILEDHIIKLWVKHRWGLPLKVLKPLNLLKMTSAPPGMTLPEFDGPSSSSQVSGASSKPEVAKILGKLPQALTDESVPTLTSLLLISSLAGKEIERALTGVPATHDHRLPEAPPARQESRPPSKILTHNLLDRTLQSRTVQGMGKSSLKAPVLPRTSPAQYLGEPCLQAEDAGEFQQTGEMSLVSQPPVCAPESKPFRKLPAPTLVNVLAARRSSLVPPKPRILRHQQKPHSKLYVPAYKGEDRRRPSSGKQKEMEELGTSKLTQVRGTEEMKQDPPSDGFFLRTWRRFLQWLFPEKKKILEQEESLKRCRPPLASAQSPQSVKATASDDSNITEAQELMTTVGEMLEKKMALHHKCCASKLKQLREECSPASRFPCYHRPPICPQQRGMSAYAVAPKGRSYPIRQRPDRSQQSLKNVQFNSQQWGLRHPHPWLSKKTGSPVSPSQHGPAMQGPSGHPHPCPRHRPRQGGLLSAQPANCSPVSSGRKTRP
uniref:SPATA31 domain-containing protein n=1 Tax=Urocitellus parryii TaxID=9999 RepID=A0A8D2GUV1_UROPR